MSNIVKTVKVVLHDGETVIIYKCLNFYWYSDRGYVEVVKNEGRTVVFNIRFVQYIGFIDDLEGR